MPDGPPPANPDLCVVGSGPAGLAVALRAADAGADVVLIESGDGHDRLDDLDRGEVVPAATAGDRRDDDLVDGPNLHAPRYLVDGRTRAPGGLSTRWSVRARPLGPAMVRLAAPEPHQLAARPDLGLPAWPLAHDVLAPWLREAASFLGVEADLCPVDDDRGQLDLGDAFDARQFVFARSEVVHRTRVREADDHENIVFVRGCTLAGIGTDGRRDRVEHVDVVDAQGVRHRLTPRHVVLAAGGIENCRLLLNSRDDGGLPDPHDLLGRHVMDHPHSRFGHLLPEAPLDVRELGRFHDFHEHDGTPVLGYYALSPGASQAHGLFDFGVTLVGVPQLLSDPTAAAVARLLTRKAQRLTPAELATELAIALRRPRRALRARRRRGRPRHGPALGGWSSPLHRLHTTEAVGVAAMTAQRPSPDNRVRLRSERDRLGLRRAALQWSWSRSEVDSYHRAALLTGARLEAAGLGTFVPRERRPDRPPNAWTGYHQMGGTAMADSPADGVVDVDGRHHQVANLHVAGSSVFPTTAGHTNPTLTVVALALRLGDMLGRP